MGHGPWQLLAAGSGALWPRIISHSLPLNNQSTLDITPDLCSPVGCLLYLCGSKDSKPCGWFLHHPVSSLQYKCKFMSPNKTMTHIEPSLSLSLSLSVCLSLPSSLPSTSASPSPSLSLQAQQSSETKLGNSPHLLDPDSLKEPAARQQGSPLSHTSVSQYVPMEYHTKCSSVYLWKREGPFHWGWRTSSCNGLW